MNERPLVSVIIPAYNSSEFITDTLQSALNQDYTSLEILVIDDGSTDNTSQIAQQFKDRIRLIQKKNGGPASARNLGIKEAKGELIAFLDADDLWTPGKIEKQVKAFIEDSQCGLVHTDHYTFQRKKEDRSYRVKTKSPETILTREIQELFWHNFIVNSSVMVRKTCLDEVGLFDENSKFISTEDYDLWLRIGVRHTIKWVNDPLTYYRIHSEGISRNIDRSYTNEMNVILKFINQDHPGIEISESIKRKRIGKIHEDWGVDLLYSGYTTVARNHLWQSLKVRWNIKTLIGLIKSFLPASLYNKLKRS